MKAARPGPPDLAAHTRRRYGGPPVLLLSFREIAQGRLRPANPDPRPRLATRWRLAAPDDAARHTSVALARTPRLRDRANALLDRQSAHVHISWGNWRQCHSKPGTAPTP